MISPRSLINDITTVKYTIFNDITKVRLLISPWFEIPDITKVY